MGSTDFVPERRIHLCSLMANKQRISSKSSIRHCNLQASEVWVLLAVMLKAGTTRKLSRPTSLLRECKGCSRRLPPMLILPNLTPQSPPPSDYGRPNTQTSVVHGARRCVSSIPFLSRTVQAILPALYRPLRRLCLAFISASESCPEI